MSAPVLRLESLCKTFGGLVVTDNVTLEVLPEELHAIIGPNGAGKTTLINEISGLVLPDAGRILFLDHDVTGQPVHARAILGLARSFQITSVLQGFSLLDNVALAAQAHRGLNLQTFRNASRDEALNALAESALAEVGLDRRAHDLARQLSHGEKRMLELAIALAMKPKLLLLDEPTAGTSPDETAALIDILRRLKRRFPMVLVEHDMNVVFSLADRVSVLIYGRIIATGPPDKVRADPKVITAYLGETA